MKIGEISTQDKRVNQKSTKSIEGTLPQGLNSWMEYLIALPILLGMGVLPLIVRLKIYTVDETIAKYSPTNPVMDFYSYHKVTFLFILMVVMMVMLFLKLRKEDIVFSKWTKLFLAGIAVFSIFTIISSLLSEYREMAIFGAPDRREGLLTYLGYILLLIYPILLMKDSKYLQIPKYAFVFLSVIFFFLAVGELFDIDILFIFPFNLFTLPSEYFAAISREGVVELTNRFALTLYNSNYTGSFCAMAIPFFVAQLLSTNNSKRSKLGYGILTISTLSILVLSRSQAGLVGTGISVGIVLFFFSKYLLSNKKMLLFFLGILVTLLLSANIASGGLFFGKISEMTSEFIELISTKEDYVYDPTYGQPITDVIITEKIARVVTSSGDFLIDFSDEKVVARNIDNTKEIVLEDGKKEIDSIVEGVVLALGKTTDQTKIGVAIYYQEEIYPRFIIYHDGQILYIGIGEQGYRIDNVIAPHWGFEGKEKLGSGRGYIWSRSIPLIKDTLIFGNGPDTYVIVFPQGDYVAKAYVGNALIWVDKPHSLYLQWMINHGVVATVGIMFALSVYALSTVRIIKRKIRYSESECMAIAIIAAVCGYLATGFFNDSLVSVAPIFWSLLGLGVTANTIISQTENGKMEFEGE